MEHVSLKDVVQNDAFEDLLRHILQQRLKIADLRWGKVKTADSFVVTDDLVQSTYHRICERFGVSSVPVSNPRIEVRIKLIKEMCTLFPSHYNVSVVNFCHVTFTNQRLNQPYY